MGTSIQDILQSDMRFAQSYPSLPYPFTERQLT